MSKILVFCEVANGELKKGSLELLTAAKASGHETAALLIGKTIRGAAETAAHYGASVSYFCESNQLENYNSEIYSAIATDAIKKFSAQIVLASASMLGKDLFPRVAAKIGAGVASDCTELSIENQTATATKPLYAGKCQAKVQFHSDIKIILMRPNQLSVEPANVNLKCSLEELSLPTSDLKTIIKEVVKGSSEKLDLTEANIIVSGGRGMKDAEGYKTLEPLAEVLGATLGATRAIVDEGWVEHTMQVGQTGKTVAPTLYIACGISGAIQHLAGMGGSKVIVAINKDPEAPIFAKATYGIVGDVFDIVPKLTDEFKKLLS